MRALNSAVFCRLESLCCFISFRNHVLTFSDKQTAGRHDLAPREDEDYIYESPDQLIPGAHPLPLRKTHVLASQHPLVSPYMPSPNRVHPYWTAPIPEYPNFDAFVPIVYPYKTMKERIIVPVFSLDGEVIYTRELDPFVFGFYPDQETMQINTAYWEVRCQCYSQQWDYQTKEIWRKAKKNWPNTGTGLPRVSNRKQHNFPWGGEKNPSKPWNKMMPRMLPKDWRKSNAMFITLKMLQGKLMIVDRLTLPEPTTEAFIALCKRMKWDVRHFGAGVLFMDGGSRLAPSFNFDANFFYGSFYNGRVKVVRPTIMCDEPVDWNWAAGTQKYKGPKGPKNPIPINRFNGYDAMNHHLLVMTEGAVMQLERECLSEKVSLLPPHIRNQMAEEGMLNSPLLGDRPPELCTIEEEVAARVEEMEKGMYKGYYDNPYDPWPDEDRASYRIDAAAGTIRREVDGKDATWTILE